MRNFKRTLALVLAVVMVIGTFATVSAASTSKWYDEAVEKLDSLSISNIGNTGAEYVTRNEFVMWIAKLETVQTSENAWNDEIASVSFTDVNDSHYKAAIAYAHKMEYIVGNGDGTFAPDKVLSLAEASAVIVRLMRYESKVVGLPDEWDMNYMNVAKRNCNAFDATFYKETDTWNPDYQLTKGEAAYLLYTIMNFDNPSDLRLTADGIDLGANWADKGGNYAKDEVYYIADIQRQVVAVSDQKYYIGATTTPIVYKNRLDELSTVTLLSADGTKAIKMPASEFAKAVRVDLGLTAERDYMNEEAEIAIFDYVDNGTMVNVKIAPDAFVNGVAVVNSYKTLQNFDINSNSLIVDTVLQMASRGEYYSEYLGWSLADVGTNTSAPNPWKPVLPTSYDSSMATSWTNITRDVTTGKATAATLNFKGVAYKYGTDIVAYDADWNIMDVDTAINTLINAAQGECYAVFNDTDADGLYDTVYVKESYAFAYADQANVEPLSSSTVVNVLTSLSNGEVVYTDMTMKYNTIGSVIYNREVGYPNSGGMASSDSYNLTVKSTGKLQLVLTASNMHPIEKQGTSQTNCVPLYYTVVDLADFFTGTITEVFVSAVEGYYEANISCTDGAIRKVYIPVEASNNVALDVAIGGATAEYTFDSTAWFTFLDSTKAAAIESGIFQEANVKDPAYLTWASAWMAGKAVEFAIDANNEVICILGTDAETGTEGFVTSVEKTETGDNTYNVTIAASASVTYTGATTYFHKTNNPLTAAKLLTHLQNSSSYNNVANTDWANAATIVGNDGVTYYKTGFVGGNRPIYASTQGITDETYFVFVNDKDTIVGPFDSEGYYLTYQGKRWVDEIAANTYNSVNSLVTAEVRASASGMFDWANYNVYHQLFTNGSLIDPNTTDNAKVDAGLDLIYVKLMQDGTSNYVLYTAAPATLVTVGTSKVNQINTTGSWSGRVWEVQVATTHTQEASWFDMEEGYFISLNEVAGTRTPTYDAYGTENGYTALYDAKVGFEPYYYRTWNESSKIYEYEIGFTTVVTYTNIPGEADAIVDKTETLMVPLYKGETGETSVQVIASTDADKAKYTIDNGFYIDDDNKVFILVAYNNSVKVVYKTDKDGNLVYSAVKYDLANAESAVTEYDVLFTDTARLGTEEAIAPYANLQVVDKPRTDDGWFPGSYYLTVDGTNYNITSSTKIVVVTPSATGFAIETKSVTDVMANGLFITEWSAVVGSGNTITTIAVVGQKAGAIASTPSTPSTPTTDKTTLVYLDGTASAYVKQDLYSKDYLVISDKTAYALPSGEEVGAIYRRYTTYEEASNSITIDLGIQGGKWYLINEDGEIVSESSIELLEGTVTSTTSSGKTVATLNGEKGIVISDMETEFFYFDAESSKLLVAGDNTNVKIVTKDAYLAELVTYETAVENAQADYDTAKAKYDAGNLSASRLAYYKDILVAAEQALVDAKTTKIDAYFNGQFWGVANSALYKSFATSQGVFQQGTPTLNFNYVIIDDVLCVFSDSFSY